MNLFISKSLIGNLDGNSVIQRILLFIYYTHFFRILISVLNFTIVTTYSGEFLTALNSFSLDSLPNDISIGGVFLPFGVQVARVPFDPLGNSVSLFESRYLPIDDKFSFIFIAEMYCIS